MRQSGLTLIELLVAIALLALLSVMAYRGLDSVMRADEQVLGVSERWQAVSLFFERFAADIGQPSLRTVRAGSGEGLPAFWGRPLTAANDGEAQLEFTRKSPPGQPDARLGYRLRGNTLELLIWPVLDRSPSSRPQAHPLLENVSALHWRYMDIEGRWHEHWPPAETRQALPRAVALELVIEGEAPVARLFALP